MRLLYYLLGVLAHPFFNLTRATTRPCEEGDEPYTGLATLADLAYHL